MGLSQSHRAIIRDVSRAFAACLAAGEGKVECAWLFAAGVSVGQNMQCSRNSCEPFRLAWHGPRATLPGQFQR